MIVLICDQMANHVDTDQTAPKAPPRSGSAVHLKTSELDDFISCFYKKLYFPLLSVQQIILAT